MAPITPQNPAISITSNTGNVSNSYNNVWNNCDISVADEKRAILEWLSPLEPRERHRTIGMGRVAGVGGWLLHTNEFTQWSQSGDGTAKPVIFCYGDPGVGKTYLSSLVVDTLCDQADAGNMAVICVYCDFHAQDEQSATGIFGTLLKQVVHGLESIPEEVQRAFEHSKRGVGGRKLLLPDILEVLAMSLSPLRRAFICIDALDEFPAKHRPELWESLQKIMGMCPNVLLFLTGRLHIHGEVEKYFPSTAEMLPVSTREHDIRLYLRMRLGRDLELDAMDKELEADILRIIPEVISETFLLISLTMDAILAKATIHQRRRALHRMTGGLGLHDAYDTTLDRIRQQGGSRARLGMEALMWISRCERPLGSLELCHALGVEIRAEDFSIQNVPPLKTLLSCALGLITIGEQESAPRLLHITLQEYLGQHPTLFVTADSLIAEISLTYLNSRLVRALPHSFGEAPATAPFLEYAACFWGTHAARRVTELVNSLALRLLDRYEGHVSAAVLCRKKINEGGMIGYVRGISGLHCIAFWKIVEIAVIMLEMERWQMNGCDSDGQTPLMWAVKYGNSRMVEMFLAQGDIEPDTPNRWGSTALSFAAQLEKEDAVQVLLNCRDVNPDLPAREGQIPLSLAAQQGHGGVVKLLLQRGDANLNSRDGLGRTPLSLAAMLGHGGVVKLLLQSGGADLNTRDAFGQTLLSLSARNGHKDVVRLLVQREDVNPNLPDNDGRSPLSLAAACEHKGVLELLLERGDIDPNSSDKDGRTPLLFAVGGQGLTVSRSLQFRSPPPSLKEGHVVKLLLERADVNLNLADRDGRTPLSWATLWGYGGVVKLLLERGDVDPNFPDLTGQTLMSLAASGGHEDFVKALLECENINPNFPDRKGQTPLSFAASRGHEGVVKLLLERGDVNPNSPDRNGRTPLSLAVQVQQEGVVKLLLGRGDVDPNSADSDGRTPLSFAAEKGHEGVGKLLLKHGDVDPNLADIDGRTPLSFAALEGHKGVVKRLLERGDVDLNSANSDGRTPLSFAAERGRKGVAKLLLQRGDTDPNSSDSNSQTPLLFAAKRGPKSIVKLLLERSDLDPNSPDSKGRTPLSFAAQRGREGVVKLLLERGDVDHTSPDSHSPKLPPFAAIKNQEGVAGQLCSSGTPERQSSDKGDRIPTYITPRNSSPKEVAYPLTATEPITTHAGTEDISPPDSPTPGLHYMSLL